MVDWNLRYLVLATQKTLGPSTVCVFVPLQCNHGGDDKVPFSFRGEQNNIDFGLRTAGATVTQMSSQGNLISLVRFVVPISLSICIHPPSSAQCTQHERCSFWRNPIKKGDDLFNKDKIGSIPRHTERNRTRFHIIHKFIDHCCFSEECEKTEDRMIGSEILVATRRL